MSRYSKKSEGLPAVEREELERTLADLDLGPGPFPPEIDFTPAEIVEVASFDAANEAQRRGYTSRIDATTKAGLMGFSQRKQDADQKRTKYHGDKASAGETVRAYERLVDKTDDERAAHEKRKKSEQNKRAYDARKLKKNAGKSQT